MCPCGPCRSLIYACEWGFWVCWKLSAAEQIKPDCCHTPAVVSNFDRLHCLGHCPVFPTLHRSITYWMPSVIDLDTSHPEENKLQTKQARRKTPPLEYWHEQSGQVMKSKAKFGTGLIWGYSYWTSTWWVMWLQAVRKCKIQFCFWSCDLLWPNLLRIAPGQSSAQSCFQFCGLPWPISYPCSYI